MKVEIKQVGKKLIYSVIEKNGDVKNYTHTFVNEVEAERHLDKMTPRHWKLDTPKQEYDEFINWIYGEKKPPVIRNEDKVFFNDDIKLK